MKKSNPTILAIETSCDETSVAITKGRQIIASVVHSQLDLHAKYGGVVPSIARLAHQEKFADVFNECLEQAGMDMQELDAVAVTRGPGLAIALEVGINKAKEIAQEYKLPLIPVNHMEGHLLSSFAQIEKDKIEIEMKFPALGVLVSGKHSEYVIINRVGEYEKIGFTLDDACGEAFDKAAVMLGLSYPGGPQISRLASESKQVLHMKREHQGLYVTNEKEDVRMPIPMAYSKDYNLSYSGLKTALKQLVNNFSGVADSRNIRQTGESEELTIQQKQDLAKVFEVAAIEMLLHKLSQILQDKNEIRQIWFGGGVIANQYLQRRIAEIGEQSSVEILLPNKQLTGDNAGMIGVAAGIRIAAGLDDSLEMADFDNLDRAPNLSL